MKKFLTLALCLAVAGGAFAQTADLKTRYNEGKKEYSDYDDARTKQMINPNDKSINPVEMAQHLINGYNIFMEVLPQDSLPDQKGKVKPKYSKDIINKINEHYNDYFNGAIAFYNDKKYYPEAYTLFMLYGDLPSSPNATKMMQATPDSTKNMAFFNAGISAYASNELPAAAQAFKKARLNNSDNPQNYIYELACWQYMAQNDSTLEKDAEKQIEEIARAGYDKFGISQMLFVNNIINSYIQKQRNDDALAFINELIAKNPENPSLYGLRAFVYDRIGNDDASVADYRKAAGFADADFDTLRLASRKIFQEGTKKWNAIEGAAPEARADVKTNYFEAAKTIAERAKQLNPDDSDVDYILENINYALDTYFNK